MIVDLRFFSFWQSDIMTETELLDRTKQFAIRRMKVTASLPGGRTSDLLGGQLLRSAMSVDANYRAAARAMVPVNRESQITNRK